VAEQDRLDTEAMPMTQPYLPTFDTGVHYKAEPELIEPTPPAPRRRWWHQRSDTPATAVGDERGDGAASSSPAVTGGAPPSESLHAQSVAAPGPSVYLKWWQLVLILLVVWVPAGTIGAGLFYWWSHDNTKYKTVVVFVVLVYVVVCTVAGLMLAMVPDRPLVSALAIAILSAVYAAVLGAAPAYGAFYCDHSQHRCLVHVLPY
jgi:hypothetical protein